jgi:hypothetical protein
MMCAVWLGISGRCRLIFSASCPSAYLGPIELKCIAVNSDAVVVLDQPCKFNPHENQFARFDKSQLSLIQEAGLQPPTVAVQGDCVVLTLRLAQSLAGKALGTGSGKTSGKIIEFVRQNPQVTIPELAGALK